MGLKVRMNEACLEKIQMFAEQLGIREEDPGVEVHIVTAGELHTLVVEEAEDGLDAVTVKFLGELQTARQEQVDAVQSETVLRTKLEELVDRYQDDSVTLADEVVGELKELIQSEE